MPVPKHCFPCHIFKFSFVTFHLSSSITIPWKCHLCWKKKHNGHKVVLCDFDFPQDEVKNQEGPRKEEDHRNEAENNEEENYEEEEEEVDEDRAGRDKGTNRRAEM